jgi:hypothetical protein
MLHTWGQSLHHHPHVHCVVPGGGPSLDHTRWVACRPGFFLPIRVLGRLFRRLFLDALRTAFAADGLGFCGDLADLVEPAAAFTRWLRELRQINWVVYAKRPFGGPAQMLAYLGRYTHRVAISNARLVSVTGDQVAFHWKDYRHHGSSKVMTLEAHEFIRRFLLHTLPDSFHRIRHYGFLANGHRAAKLALCRRLLDMPHPEPAADPVDDTLPPHRPERCPCCGAARWSPASCRGRCPLAHPSGTTPHDPATTQHRSFRTGRRSRPRGSCRSPPALRSGCAPEWRQLPPTPRPPRTSAATTQPPRSPQTGRDPCPSQPIWCLGPEAADTIPIAAPAIPRLRSIRLQ